MMKKFLVLFWLAVIACFGCGSSFDSGSDEETVSATAQAVTVGISKGTLQVVNGTYGAGCTTYTGAWSTAINGYAGSLTNPQLKVVRNNATCTLSITSIQTSEGLYTGSIALTATYAASGTQFSNGATKAFFVNARITPDLTFAANFVVELLHSADADNTSNNVAATSVVTGSATASQVAAPNYTLAAGGYLFEASGGLVTNSTGTLTFNAGSQTAQDYVIVAGNVAITFIDIHNAFIGAGAPITMTGTIPFSSVAVVGMTVPGNRTVIMRNRVNGVSSYQTFTFSLTP